MSGVALKGRHREGGASPCHFKALMKQYFPDGSDRPKVEALARQYIPELFGE